MKSKTYYQNRVLNLNKTYKATHKIIILTSRRSHIKYAWFNDGSFPSIVKFFSCKKYVHRSYTSNRLH